MNPNYDGNTFYNEIEQEALKKQRQQQALLQQQSQLQQFQRYVQQQPEVREIQAKQLATGVKNYADQKFVNNPGDGNLFTSFAATLQDNKVTADDFDEMYKKPKPEIPVVPYTGSGITDYGMQQGTETNNIVDLNNAPRDAFRDAMNTQWGTPNNTRMGSQRNDNSTTTYDQGMSPTSERLQRTYTGTKTDTDMPPAFQPGTGRDNTNYLFAPPTPPAPAPTQANAQQNTQQKAPASPVTGVPDTVNTNVVDSSKTAPTSPPVAPAVPTVATEPTTIMDQDKKVNTSTSYSLRQERPTTYAMQVNSQEQKPSMWQQITGGILNNPNLKKALIVGGVQAALGKLAGMEDNEIGFLALEGAAKGFFHRPNKEAAMKLAEEYGKYVPMNRMPEYEQALATDDVVAIQAIINEGINNAATTKHDQAMEKENLSREMTPYQRAQVALKQQQINNKAAKDGLAVSGGDGAGGAGGGLTPKPQPETINMQNDVQDLINYGEFDSWTGAGEKFYPQGMMSAPNRIAQQSLQRITAGLTIEELSKLKGAATDKDAELAAVAGGLQYTNDPKIVETELRRINLLLQYRNGLLSKDDLNKKLKEIPSALKGALSSGKVLQGA